jgi:hypothetical protein
MHARHYTLKITLLREHKAKKFKSLQHMICAWHRPLEAISELQDSIWPLNVTLETVANTGKINNREIMTLPGVAMNRWPVDERTQRAVSKRK